MVVQDRHNPPLPERRDDLLVRISSGAVLGKGVLLYDLAVDIVHVVDVDPRGRRGVGEGFRQGHVRVQGMVDRVGQAHAVETLRGHEVGDVVDRLLVQALGRVGLEVPAPVDAS